MRIGWISSRTWPESVGGAEATDFTYIQEGKKRGHEIAFLRSYDPTCDFFVLSNVHDWPVKFVEGILRNASYALYRHDAFNIIYQQPYFKNPFVVVFMSPLQKDFYLQRINVKKYFLTPCALQDLDQYKTGEKKTDHYVYIGDLLDHKGLRNIIQYAIENPHEKFVLYGKRFQSLDLPKNTQYLGELKPEEIPDILNKAKHYISLPSLIDTCPRTVTGAYLSGCKIIYNNNVGLFSWNWDWPTMTRAKLKQILMEAPTKFWANLEGAYTER